MCALETGHVKMVEIPLDGSLFKTGTRKGLQLCFLLPWVGGASEDDSFLSQKVRSWFCSYFRQVTPGWNWFASTGLQPCFQEKWSGKLDKWSIVRSWTLELLASSSMKKFKRHTFRVTPNLTIEDRLRQQLTQTLPVEVFGLLPTSSRPVCGLASASSQPGQLKFLESSCLVLLFLSSLGRRGEAGGVEAEKFIGASGCLVSRSPVGQRLEAPPELSSARGEDSRSSREARESHFSFLMLQTPSIYSTLPTQQFRLSVLVL